MSESPAAAPPPPLVPDPGIFRNRDFALTWAARLAMTLGVMAEAVTIGWQVYAVSRVDHPVRESAFLVGMVGLVQFIPYFCLTLIAGQVADRFERKRIIMICLMSQVVLDLALVGLALHAHSPLIAIFGVAAGFGVVRAFASPAFSAMMPMLVERAVLPRAVAWSSLSWQTGSIIGPVIAGALVAIHPSVAYGAAALLYGVAAILVFMIRKNTTPQRQTGSAVAMIREGLVYVWSNRIVFGAISLDLAAVLLGGATALLPVFARDVLHVGASGFGILRAGPAIGAASVAIILTQKPIHRRAGLWMLGGVALFGIATLGFALSRYIWLSVIFLALLGAGDAISVYVRQTLVQIVTPDHMRGRVSAVSGVFIGASNELGEFETGVVARFIGPIGAAVFGGVGSLVVVGAWAKLFPTLRKADHLIPPDRR